MTLQKEWVDGARGDTAALAVTSSAPTGSADQHVDRDRCGRFSDRLRQPCHRRLLYSSQAVAVDETLGTGNIGSYDSRIACDQTGLSPNGDGRGGTFQVAVPPVAVTCTITNTRTSATMTLQKTWVNSAAGDTVDLSISLAPRRPGRLLQLRLGRQGREHRYHQPGRRAASSPAEQSTWSRHSARSATQAPIRPVSPATNPD